MIKSSEDLLARLTGLGHPRRRGPYSIPRLVKIAEELCKTPRRLSQGMRIRLDDWLKAHGIYGDSILDQTSRTTCLHLIRSGSPKGL